MWYFNIFKNSNNPILNNCIIEKRVIMLGESTYNKLFNFFAKWLEKTTSRIKRIVLIALK